MNTHSTSSFKTFFGKSLWQIIPVMLGVYFGLLASNWNDDRKQNDLQVKVLQKIKEDILANKKQIEGVLDYHKSLADTAQRFFRTASLEEMKTYMIDAQFDRNNKNRVNVWQGTRAGTLQDAGFQTAIMTGIFADMDIELVAQLSDVQRTQENYGKMANNYLQTLINKDSNAKVIDYVQFMLVFSMDITFVEERLLKLYEQVLPKIDAIIP